jgi:hypothetical protein
MVTRARSLANPKAARPRRAPCAARPIAVLGLAAVVLCSSIAQAQVVRREYAIKASVVCMLAKCVTWPPEATPKKEEPLVIGILGRDPFVENNANQIDQAVADARAKGSNLTVKRFDSAKDYTPCHILFVSNQGSETSDEKTVADRLKAAGRITVGKPVLILSEAPGLAQQGAAANLLFDRTSNLIQLELNPEAAARSSLKLTPDLLRLKVVRIVRDPPR